MSNALRKFKRSPIVLAAKKAAAKLKRALTDDKVPEHLPKYEKYSGAGRGFAPSPRVLRKSINQKAGSR